MITNSIIIINIIIIIISEGLVNDASSLMPATAATTLTKV
jgi:hypothetical protein